FGVIPAKAGIQRLLEFLDSRVVPAIVSTPGMMSQLCDEFLRRCTRVAMNAEELDEIPVVVTS
ncbi:MAG TPA: hypothetical protein VHV54_12390, partial [Candidatus Binatia bacterium]|nr:hypothetical protein [Candidatus Binatia bacterium]